MDCLPRFDSPQLKKLHSGKVRESFRADAGHRLILATDRISSFDRVLKTPVPAKGAVLNSLAAWWFDKTRDICPNHFVRIVDPAISLVREAKPIRLEMIIRAYLTGSAWRKYQKGERTLSGVSLPDGLTQNAPFPKPIVTPTTKEASDRPISAEEIVKEGWTSREIYEKMCSVSLCLFEKGSAMLLERGIILVDTKYEFGLIEGELVLIDEIHTPDSSRFWLKEAYESNPESVEQLDKEFVRNYLMEHKQGGEYPETLPEEIVAETSRRYLELYERITGAPLNYPDADPADRVLKNLKDAGFLKEGCVLIVMGSPSDIPYAEKMAKRIKNYDITVKMRVVSAHKNGEKIPVIMEDVIQCHEPVSIIAVAGRSNGLGGALSANLPVPVINCPPFSDKTDFLVNINSSLMMPSDTPALTVVDPKNAADAAVLCLNIPSLKSRFRKKIQKVKDKLDQANAQLQEQQDV
ncbi:MAG: phosphoribosylaminoimidazolesuccinocarboxamide synthase [Candidatus Neomarinimicrobiota bacterium]|nr:MAG: phosphoribosylaminoimidazolesuccinocarboxamide synthase [Candidatus Neomarinimicrobiota bacterium]